MKMKRVIAVVSVLSVVALAAAHAEYGPRGNRTSGTDRPFQLASCGSTACGVPHKAVHSGQAGVAGDEAAKSFCPPGCTKPCCADKKAAGCAVTAKAACGTQAAGCGMKAAACGPKGKACHAGTAQGAAEAEITTAALAALLNSNVPLVLLDARSGKYDDGRRIPGAGSLNAASSDEEIANTVPDKNALVVTYCSNLKCPASAALAKRLRTLGYGNVIEYPEGIQGWADAGRDVVGPVTE